MRAILAFVLVAHGIAHLPGFLSSWRLANFPELPYRTSLFAGGLEVGDAGMRAIGVLWLAAAIAFVGAGASLATGVHWSGRAAALLVWGSLVLCAAGLPEARFGLLVDIGLAVTLALMAQPS